FPARFRNQDLRRRNESELRAERRRLLSDRRQLHVAQRTEVSAAAFVGNFAGKHRVAACRRTSRPGSERRGGGVGRRGVPRFVAKGPRGTGTRRDFSAVSAEGT